MNSQLIYDAIWFILPLYISNMTPVFLKKLNFLKYPVDFNKTLSGKRIFGHHKTWRGLIFGTLTGGIVSLLQLRGIWIGIVMGLGGLIGDMIGSFIKRRMNIPEGGRLLLVDQIDFLIGSLIFCYIFGFWTLGLNQTIFLLIATPVLSYICSWIGYKLKIKNVPW